MRAYIRAVLEYNDALENGRIAGPNADEVISILTQYTFIKDPSVHRQITPAAIDPDGRLGLASLRNDLAYFKEQRFAEQAAKELGPYRPRGK
jgi:NitT/TauT family transport system substrate-binding protein